ncbi:uncharacterized protein LOC128546086, partial [Mercenaria mercenaria]|uniref:uncharacterized protein LOC128546086 n=1 Tax=Mercenaria mercenaria TaxID=6596 RepID=UPI00234EF54A
MFFFHRKTRQNDGNGQRRKCGKRIFVVGLVVMLVIITISSVATTIFVFTSKDQGKFTTENDVTSVESSNTGLTNSIPTKPFSTSIPTTSTTKLAPEHTVAFENSSYMFNIGEKASITCDVQNMPDWKRIEIRRSDGHVIIGVNSTDQSLDSNEPHISLVADGSNFANDSATLAVVFDVVMCSDAMG